MSKVSKPNHDPEGLAPTLSHTGEVTESKIIEHDAVFGDITEDGPNYRNVCVYSMSDFIACAKISKVGWLGTTALMIKTQIGLGVLSMPVVFNTLGIVPGILTLVIVAAVTTWSDYMVYVFKLNHPEVYGIDDVGRMFFGRVGFEIFGAMYTLCKFAKQFEKSPSSNICKTSLSSPARPCSVSPSP